MSEPQEGETPKPQRKGDCLNGRPHYWKWQPGVFGKEDLPPRQTCTTCGKERDVELSKKEE